jgi:DNA-binding protein HU-beta
MSGADVENLWKAAILVERFPQGPEKLSTEDAEDTELIGEFPQSLRVLSVKPGSAALTRSALPFSISNLAPRERLVIKLDIINEVVSKTGITKTKAELAVETVFDSMKKALAHGDRIELRGFGVFNVRPRKTGIGRNPRTGAEVNIPPGKAVRFKPGKELQSIE